MISLHADTLLLTALTVITSRRLINLVYKLMILFLLLFAAEISGNFQLGNVKSLLLKFIETSMVVVVYVL